VPDEDEHRQAYARSLRELGELLMTAPDLSDAMTRLLRVALTAAPHLDAATVTLLGTDGTLRSAAATSAASRAVDEREYELAEGPCVAALRTGEEHHIDDVRSDPRWPAFNAVCEQHGFLAASGLPLVHDGVIVGSLDLFAAEPAGLDEATLATLRRLVPPLGKALARARRSASQR